MPTLFQNPRSKKVSVGVHPVKWLSPPGCFICSPRGKSQVIFSVLSVFKRISEFVCVWKALEEWHSKCFQGERSGKSKRNALKMILEWTDLRAVIPLCLLRTSYTHTHFITRIHVQVWFCMFTFLFFTLWLTFYYWFPCIFPVLSLWLHKGDIICFFFIKFLTQFP